MDTHHSEMTPAGKWMNIDITSWLIDVRSAVSDIV